MKNIIHKMPIACLDYESCFAPELWLIIAEEFGLKELRITTKEEPDFDKLMRMRIDILEKHGKTLDDCRAVAEKQEPLEGAPEFLSWLQDKMPAIFVSDMVYELAAPIFKKIDYPTMLSTHIYRNQNGRMVYDRRIDDRKARTVRALKSLNYHTIALGDSFNDIGLLEAADTALLYRPSKAMIERFPDLEAFQDLASVRRAFEESIEVLKTHDMVTA